MTYYRNGDWIYDVYPCPSCHGTGRDASGYGDCRACHGLGYAGTNVTCRVCNTWLLPNQPNTGCPSCHGTGIANYHSPTPPSIINGPFPRAGRR